MSYRTYCDDIQIFGNHECYKEWIDFIKSQGIKVDEEHNYKGEIHDFMGALKVIEQIVLNMEAERRQRYEQFKQEYSDKKFTIEELEELRKHIYGISSIFDFRHIYDTIINEDVNDRFRTSLFDKLFDYVENSYMFMPYAFFKACESKLEPDKHFTENGYFNCYKLKDGESIHVEAH